MFITKKLKLEIDIKDGVIAVKSDSNFFLSEKEVGNNLNYDFLTNHNLRRTYLYYEGADLEDRFKEELSADYIVNDRLVKKDSIALIRSKQFSKDNLIWHNSYDGLYYKFESDMPLTKPYHISYIGGITNETYDLKKAYEILSNNTWVSDIEKIDIPYYNATEESNKAIEFTVKLPQSEYDKLVKYYRDIKQEKYWSTRLREALASSWQIMPLDILGLSKALKGK